MNRFYVSGSYRTERGRVASFGKVIIARDTTHAMAIARAKITGDKRRKYNGKLNLRSEPMTTPKTLN